MCMEMYPNCDDNLAARNLMSEVAKENWAGQSEIVRPNFCPTDLVAGWVGVVAAGRRAVIIRMRDGCTHGADRDASREGRTWTRIPRAVPRGMPADHDIAAAEMHGEAIDEQRRGAGRVCQVAFEHGDFEAEIVALDLRRLQRDDRVSDRGAVVAQNRNGGVRRILGEAVG